MLWHGSHHGFYVVVAVGAFAQYVKTQIDLGIGEEYHKYRILFQSAKVVKTYRH